MSMPGATRRSAWVRRSPPAYRIMNLKRLLQPPDFDAAGELSSTDAYRLWLARLLTLASSASISILTLSAAFAARTNAPDLFQHLLLDFLPLGSSLIVLIYLLRRDPDAGYSDAPLFAWLLSLWIYLLLDVIASSGMNTLYVSVMLFLLLLAGLLLDSGRFIAFASIIVIGLASVMLLDLAGALPTGGLYPALLTRLERELAVFDGRVSRLLVWFGSIANLALAAGLLHFYNRSVDYSLSRSRRELQERRTVEAALRRSQERYRNFIEHSFEGVWQIRFEPPIPLSLPPAEQIDRIFQTGRVSDANHAQARMLGAADRDDLIGMQISELFGDRENPSLPGSQFSADMLDLIASGYRQFERETSYISTPSTRRTFSISTVGIIDHGADGDTLVSLWGSQRDITAQRAAQAALQLRNDQLTTLHRIAAGLATIKDLSSVLMEVLSSLKAALPLDAFYVALYDEAALRMRFPLVYDQGIFYPEQAEVEPPEWLAPVLTNRRPLRFNRTPEQIEAQRASGALRVGNRRLVSASILAAPLQVGARLIGVISVQSYTPDAYNDQQLDFLALAAQGVAAAVDNATLYEDLERELQERVKAENALQELNAELESRVEQRTAELENAVKELEAFSYSVSHDLRSPLRSIDGYSRFLLADYSDCLDAEGRLFLANVRQAAQRMGVLIDNLLDLSRVSRLDLHLQPVDLSALVEEIAAALRLVDPGRLVEFKIEPGLSALADPHLVRLALENLVDNAWKFTSRAPLARIEFSRIDPADAAAAYPGPPFPPPDGGAGPECLCFCLRDNGAGFDMRYADMLFKPFSRLHGEEEFDGTGIGLAGVRRIIERHRGRIWAEGAVDRGAAFFFTLPAAEN